MTDQAVASRTRSSLPFCSFLQWLRLQCEVPSGCPEPHLCQHISVLTCLTHLNYTAWPRDEGGTAAFAHGLSGLISLQTLQLTTRPLDHSLDCRH